MYNMALCTRYKFVSDIRKLGCYDRHNIGITEILWKEALIQQLPYLTYLFSYINSFHYLENHYVA